MLFRSICIAGGLLAAGLVAQGGLGKPVNIGTSGSHRIDVQTTASGGAGYTVNGALGVEVDNAGHIWVTARRDTTSTANPHILVEYDANGAYVAWYAQPPGTAGSGWGIRDLAHNLEFNPTSSDPELIYGGCENSASANTIFAWDPVGKSWVNAANVVITAPVNTVVRALALMPASSPAVQAAFPIATKGVFVTANFGSVVEYIDVATGAPAAPATPSVTPAAYGAWFDTQTDTVWWFSQSGGPVASMQVDFEQASVTGVPTGQHFIGDLGIPGTNPGGLAGGASGRLDPATGITELTYLTQATVDEVVRVEGNYNYGSPGCMPGSLHFSNCWAYAGSATYSIVIQGLTTPLGYLAAGVAGPTINPLPWLFVCGIDLQVVPLPPVLFPIPAVGGTANATFSLAAAPPGPYTINWQWLEVTPAGITVSRAGSTYIQ
ncbi:MAG: hypothetical protein IPM29_25115 [Planctomycetes bacterium]|nr:hypothetical protein [Planctomycetota bacterium]